MAVSASVLVSIPEDLALPLAEPKFPHLKNKSNKPTLKSCKD